VSLKCRLIDYLTLLFVFSFPLYSQFSAAVNLKLIVIMASYKVEVVESSPISVLGEGPHWDVERQSLYYNDIYGDVQSISRYDYREEKTYNAVIPGHPVISFIIPVAGTKDEFIVGSGKKIVLIKWDGKSSTAPAVKTVGEVESSLPENRFNDAKCDPSGRFYGGTMRIGERQIHFSIPPHSTS
jgi:gluconolactonase